MKALQDFNFGNVPLTPISANNRSNVYCDLERCGMMIKKILIVLLCLVKIISTVLFFYAPSNMNNYILLSFSIYSFPFLLATTFINLSDYLMRLIILSLLILPLLWCSFIVLIFAKKRLQKISTIGLISLLGLDIVCCIISSLEQPTTWKIFNIIFSISIAFLIMEQGRGRHKTRDGSWHKRTGDGSMSFDN